MNISVTPTGLDGVLLVAPEIFTDERGFFYESYSAVRFAEHGLALTFVQDNHSRSGRGVLRGLHYQLRQPQGKLVRVAVGEVFGVVNQPEFQKRFGLRAAVAQIAPEGGQQRQPIQICEHRCCKSRVST